MSCMCLVQTRLVYADDYDGAPFAVDCTHFVECRGPAKSVAARPILSGAAAVEGCRMGRGRVSTRLQDLNTRYTTPLNSLCSCSQSCWVRSTK